MMDLPNPSVLIVVLDSCQWRPTSHRTSNLSRSWKASSRSAVAGVENYTSPAAEPMMIKTCSPNRGLPHGNSLNGLTRRTSNRTTSFGVVRARCCASQDAEPRQSFSMTVERKRSVVPVRLCELRSGTSVTSPGTDFVHGGITGIRRQTVD